MKELVSKLHHEATTRNESKLKKKKEIENLELEQPMLQQDNLVSKSTKLIILERFVKDFDTYIETAFKQENDYELTFDEYASLLYGIGFIKIQYDSKYNENFEKSKSDTKSKKKVKNREEEKDSLEVKKQMYRRRNEYNYLKDSWKFLTSDTITVDKVNSNQVLIFCAAVIGLYDGEGDPQSPTNSPTNSLLSPITLQGEENKTPLELKISEVDENVETKMNKETIIDTCEKKENLRNYSHSLEKSRINNEIQKHTARTHVTQTYTARAKKHRVLLKVVIPEFDLGKYSYHANTVKHIHAIFRQFYTNRVEFVTELKRKHDLETGKRSRSANKNEDSHKFTIGHKSNLSAKHWRDKNINVKLRFH